MHQEQNFLARIPGQAVADGTLQKTNQLRVCIRGCGQKRIPQLKLRVRVEYDRRQLGHQIIRAVWL